MRAYIPQLWTPAWTQTHNLVNTEQTQQHVHRIHNDILYVYISHNIFCCQCIHVHLAWKSWHTCIHDYIEQSRAEKTTVPLLHGTFCSDMTSNISFVMFDTPYINGCLREKMHLKRCTVHHTVDPTTMRIDTWTVRCAHIFCTGTRTVYIRTQVFLHADLSIVGRIRTSGHPGLSSWGLAAWQRLHKSQHHHLRLHRRVLSHRAEWYTQTEKKQGEAMGLERRWIHFDQCLAKFSKSCLEGCGWRSKATKVFFYSYVLIKHLGLQVTIKLWSKELNFYSRSDFRRFLPI